MISDVRLFCYPHFSKWGDFVYDNDELLMLLDDDLFPVEYEPEEESDR